MNKKVLETPAYGDLDNYAKQLLDTIKGSGGILIDDCQVQHLDISWIDVPKDEWFEIEIRASPDDFLPTPLKLHQMPDGLYYPFSELLWTTEGVVSVPAEATVILLEAFAKMTSSKKSLRHKLRQEGMQQFRAFQTSKYVSPVLMGFHRSRVIDSSFELVDS